MNEIEVGRHQRHKSLFLWPCFTVQHALESKSQLQLQHSNNNHNFYLYGIINSSISITSCKQLLVLFLA